jgi:DNA-binding NarL/FixJ family response regulator
MSFGGPLRAALVEDHADTRAAIAQTLARFPDRVDLLGTFADAEAFLASDVRSRVQVALIDLGLPAMSGCELISALRRDAPDACAIALTVFDDEETVFAAMTAGASGYLLKDEPSDQLVRAIEDAACGRNPISSRVTSFLIQEVVRRVPKVLLSDRETEVARALSSGLSYAECGERLGIQLGTVQDYVKRIYRKLDVHSKQEVRRWVEQSASALPVRRSS